MLLNHAKIPSGIPQGARLHEADPQRVIYLACHSEHLRIFEVPNQGVESVKLQRYIIIQHVNPRQLRRPHALDKMQEAISKMELENMEVIGGRPRLYRQSLSCV